MFVRAGGKELVQACEGSSATFTYDVDGRTAESCGLAGALEKIGPDVINWHQNAEADEGEIKEAKDHIASRRIEEWESQFPHHPDLFCHHKTPMVPEGEKVPKIEVSDEDAWEEIRESRDFWAEEMASEFGKARDKGDEEAMLEALGLDMSLIQVTDWWCRPCDAYHRIEKGLIFCNECDEVVCLRHGCGDEECEPIPPSELLEAMTDDENRDDDKRA